jgi:hypothetical protein
VQRDLDGLLDPARDAVGADEVPTGAARDDRDVHVVASPETVGHLVDGPVAPDDDEKPGATVGGLPGELGEVPGSL